MEIRANYILVGAFAVLMIFLAVGYALWAAKSIGRDAVMEYCIQFNGDVSGLSVGAPVTFNGIRVGIVKDLHISPNDTSKVDVLIEVQSSLPIRSDSEASLQVLGLTGQASVLISSGNPKSPMLVDVSPDVPPIIASRESNLQQAVQSLPEILGEAKRTFRLINGFLNDENMQNFSQLLANLAEVSENTKNNSARLDKLLTDLDKTAVNADVMISDLRETSQTLNDTVSKVSPGLIRFSNNGLDEFNSLVLETRLLVNSMGRMSNKIETDPRQFLFGSQIQEYSPRND